MQHTYIVQIMCVLQIHMLNNCESGLKTNLLEHQSKAKKLS